MARRTVWVLVAVIAAAGAGFLLAVLVPRSSDDSTPTKVIINKTVTLAPPDSSVPLSRGVVMEWFARKGEPLVLRLDVAAGDPGSPVDAIFVPAKQDVPEPPFELTLFDDTKSAEQHAKYLEDVAGSVGQVARARNAVLLVSRMESPERRARLISMMRSLP